MTPEGCTGLAALLLEYRDWLDDTHPGHLDVALIDAIVDGLADVRRELVTDGAT